MILNLKCLTKDDYIRCALSKIEYAKFLFLYNMQLGQEVFIPRDLS